MRILLLQMVSVGQRGNEKAAPSYETKGFGPFVSSGGAVGGSDSCGSAPAEV